MLVTGGIVIEERDEDAAYDKWRQEQVDNERKYPDEKTLVARGKYATLAAERRDALKGLQADMVAASNCASRVLRSASGKTEDIEVVQEELDTMGKRVGAAFEHVQVLAALALHLEELKPAAWGKGEAE